VNFQKADENQFLNSNSISNEIIQSEVNLTTEYALPSVVSNKTLTLKRILFPTVDTSQMNTNEKDVEERYYDNGKELYKISLLTQESLSSGFRTQREGSIVPRKLLLSNIYSDFEKSDAFTDFKNITRSKDDYEAKQDLELVHIQSSYKKGQERLKKCSPPKDIHQPWTNKNGKDVLDIIAKGNLNRGKVKLHGKYNELNAVANKISTTVKDALDTISNEAVFKKMINPLYVYKQSSTKINF